MYPLAVIAVEANVVGMVLPLMVARQEKPVWNIVAVAEEFVSGVQLTLFAIIGCQLQEATTEDCHQVPNLTAGKAVSVKAAATLAY